MAEAPFDTLKLFRRLEAAGFPTQQAGDMAEAIAEALSQFASKADLAALGAATKADIAALHAELKADMALGAELKTGIAALRTELKAEIEVLRRDVTIRLGSMIVVATGGVAGRKVLRLNPAGDFSRVRSALSPRQASAPCPYRRAGSALREPSHDRR